LEKGFNIMEVDTKEGKVAWQRGLTLWKHAPKVGSYLEKGFNILETSTEGGKMYRKHP
jgi:hypothetical protein